MRQRYIPRDTMALLSIPCLCFVLLAFLTLRYAIAVPMLDEWDFVPILQKSYQGQLSPADLWAQHNEHRMVFPTLIMLGLAHLSHWNLRWELAANLLLAAGILIVISYQFQQTERNTATSSLRWVTPVASIAVFSLRQSENWMWGWQIQIFLNILVVVTGVALLTSPALTWRKFVAAMLCGLVASYSFANGLLFWIVGAYALWTRPRDTQYTASMATWCICAILIGVSYFYHYVRPPGHPPALYALSHPGVFVAYFLSYIGALVSIKDTPLLGVPMGILGLTLLALSWHQVRRSGKLPPTALTPYIAYALYALLSALISAAGRSGFGTKQAMSSRYLTISELFWIATLAMGYLAARHRETTSASAQAKPWAKQVLVVAGIVFAINSLKNIGIFKQRYEWVQEVQQQMRKGDYAAGADLYPVPQIVEERAPFLKRHRLALYRDP